MAVAKQSSAVSAPPDEIGQRRWGETIIEGRWAAATMGGMRKVISSGTT